MEAKVRRKWQGTLGEFTTTVAGFSLGGDTGRRQETITQAQGRLPWFHVSISVAINDAVIKTSFDGKSYSNGIIVAAFTTLDLPVLCRGIRVRARRWSQRTWFVIHATERG